MTCPARSPLRSRHTIRESERWPFPAKADNLVQRDFANRRRGDSDCVETTTDNHDSLRWAATSLEEPGFRAGGSAACPLFIAGLHRFKTSVRHKVGSFKMLFDQQILFRQLLERYLVFLQIRTEEAQHFPRRY